MHEDGDCDNLNGINKMHLKSVTESFSDPICPGTHLSEALHVRAFNRSRFGPLSSSQSAHGMNHRIIRFEAMRTPMGSRPLVALAFAFVLTAFAYAASENSALVSGVVKCDDCTQKHLTFQGALVGIECRNSKGEIYKRGVASIDENGAFKAKIPLLESLEECHARLLSKYSKSPCSSPSTNGNGDASSKLVLKNNDVGDTTTFVISTDLRLSSVACPAAFLLSFPPLPKFPPKPFKKPLPPLPKFPPKPKPPISLIKPLPPLPKFPPKPKLSFPPKPAKKPLPPFPKFPPKPKPPISLIKPPLSFPKFPPKPKLSFPPKPVKKPLPPLPKLPPKPKPPISLPKFPPKPKFSFPPKPKFSFPPKPSIKPFPPFPKFPPKPKLSFPPKPSIKPFPFPPKPFFPPFELYPSKVTTPQATTPPQVATPPRAPRRPRLPVFPPLSFRFPPFPPITYPPADPDAKVGAQNELYPSKVTTPPQAVAPPRRPRLPGFPPLSFRFPPFPPITNPPVDPNAKIGV